MWIDVTAFGLRILLTSGNTLYNICLRKRGEIFLLPMVCRKISLREFVTTFNNNKGWDKSHKKNYTQN